MNHPLDGQEPVLVWNHFRALSERPRGSKAEGAAVEYVREFAARRGLAVRTDGAGNVVVQVPGTAGREAEAITILQGHLDMVCEKDSGIEHDFTRDPIRLRVEGDYLLATGTTLGADNGIGVAAALALAEDPTAAHGPLELLFTVDEEGGLTGASGLDPALLTGRRLLNLDTEEDGALYVGCAGGQNLNLELPLARVAPRRLPVAAEVKATGLRGGHSGVDIHEHRANAIKLLVRALRAALGAGVPLAIVDLAGGNKHNAIPREARALVRLPKAALPELASVVARAVEDFRREFAAIDPGLRVDVTPIEEPAGAPRPWSATTARRVLAALAACPSGVLSLSRDVPGLVETSNNLGVVVTEGDRLKVTTLARSFVAAGLAAAQEQVRACFEPAEATVNAAGGYPNWQPDLASPVLGALKDSFVRLRGPEPRIKAIHAGLECGVIGEKVPGMDMVSFGPQIENPHSPGERLHLPSVPKFYELLREVMASLH